MIKSTLTNNAYRNVLFVYVALSILSQLFSFYKGDFKFISLVSLTANITVFILFVDSHRHLKQAIQGAAALALLNAAVSLYARGALAELLYSGSLFWLLMVILLNFGPAVYLLTGSRKYILNQPVEEWDTAQHTMQSSNLRGILNKGTLTLLLIPFAAVITFWSMGHYADGGCDGGLCALYLFTHGAPLAIAWGLTIIAVNKALGRKGSYPIYAMLAFFVNLIILLPDYGYRMEELKYPAYVILGFLVLSFVLYSNADASTATDEAEGPETKSVDPPIIGWKERDEDEPND
ncbi:hypothetical protein ACSX1A_10460 [Pontibacter sp. MBLB2868]|uniref:hypothetical protein n=1 Tax=Pontibacter sp. MBLB2868 TaxID=3451555 RepID=UPI003F74B7F8